MASTSRGVSHLTSALKTPNRPRLHICLSCRRAQSRAPSQSQPRRSYASTATASVTIEAPSIPQNLPTKFPASPAPEQQPAVAIHAGVVLSRAPLITPDPHPFETAYFLYQRRLNERLVLPFTQYFYFKRGTPAFEHWRAKRRERNNTAARDIGNYNPFKPDGWNDEALVGDDVGEPDKVVKKLLEDEGKDVAESIDAETAALSQLGGLRRKTDADENNDQQSLERSLDRTLYLVVKKPSSGKAERWEFPSGAIEGQEGVKEGAMRVLDTSCGVNMNTWFVGNHPVGHHVNLPQPKMPGKADARAKAGKYSGTRRPLKEVVSEEAVADEPAPTTSSFGKTFFMKARIMAGQADITTASGAEDFKWLAKDEIEKLFDPAYWSRVKNMLVEQ